jgi:subtilisin family serine protease
MFAKRLIPSGGALGSSSHLGWITCASLVLALSAAGTANAWIHDRNSNRIDDRLERVHAFGLAAAFENENLSQRMVIAAFAGSPIVYGVYVGMDHPPTAADRLQLTALGVTAIHGYRYIPYVRGNATFAQIGLIASLPGVTRVEAIPMMYTNNHYGSRVVRAQDSRGLGAAQNGALFPSARQERGLDGTGVVVGILDTGVNDAIDAINPLYPGHESVRGKFLGGGEFFSGVPELNTGLDQSVNPQDHGAAVSSYHATHVAGTAIGTGGPGGFFGGVAPMARLVDCKVLSDAGVGFGSADGVEWCIYNRNRMWPGLAGADTIYRGIDVLNLSLGGLSNSDGTDAGALMINAAVDSGIIVCIATGNDDSTSYIASPASADKSIAVGATSHARTLDRGDDRVTTFSNEGPRPDDGDSDHFDEMKPNVSAPGAGIVSADGDPTTTGTSYKSLSGTSMATPHVAGVCALLRQAHPTLTPLQIRSILQDTAEHDILSEKGDRTNDPYGLDPNYDPGCGWGLVDTYAAALEIANSTSGVQVSQFHRLVARPEDGEVDIRWTTQREFSFQGFHVHRASDVNGAPGSFTQINATLIPPSPNGDSQIAGDDNRTLYHFVDDSPLLAVGNRYWYRVVWIDAGGGAHAEPPASVAYGKLAAVATVRFGVAHNAVDNDLLVRVGADFDYDIGNTGEADFERLGPGAIEADSVVVEIPNNAATATIGNTVHYWSMDFTADDGVSPFLPPKAWFLYVQDAGYVNRTGRVTSFSIVVWDSPGATTGTEYTTNHVPMPQPTGELGLNPALLWIPERNTTGVSELPAITHALEARPNPSFGRATFEYSLGANAGDASLAIYDMQGRLVQDLGGPAAAGRHVVQWNGTDVRGGRVRPGVYFVRLRVGNLSQSHRLVVLE